MDEIDAEAMADAVEQMSEEQLAAQLAADDVAIEVEGARMRALLEDIVQQFCGRTRRPQ